MLEPLAVLVEPVVRGHLFGGIGCGGGGGGHVVVVAPRQGLTLVPFSSEVLWET